MSFSESVRHTRTVSYSAEQTLDSRVSSPQRESDTPSTPGGLLVSNTGGIVVAFLSLLVFGYSLIALGNILVGGLVALLLTGGYVVTVVLLRVVSAVERIADAADRRAAAAEARAAGEEWDD